MNCDIIKAFKGKFPSFNINNTTIYADKFKTDQAIHLVVKLYWMQAGGHYWCNDPPFRSFV